MATFSVCTYNVHTFYDGKGKPTYQDIMKLLAQMKPDVLCLQEATAHCLNKLQADLQYKHKYYKNRGVAIFSNYEMEEVEYQVKGNRTRGLTVKLTLDPALEPLYLTALHLDHRVEPNRMKEIKNIEKCLEDVFAEEGGQIWTGDFNCLTREDYDDKTWGDIARVRRENSWEPPRTAVSEEMTRLGFTDCWASVGRPGPVSTCRSGHS